MKPGEPNFLVLEYVTITKDPRTGLVVAIGGTERAADILQRTGGFLTAPGPRGDYHRLPHGLPIEQQRLKATAASHALLCAGHSVHLGPALKALTAPNGERDAALRYLAQLAERASRAESSTEVAEVLSRDRRAGQRPAAAHPGRCRQSLDRLVPCPGRRERRPRPRRRPRQHRQRAIARHPPDPRRPQSRRAGSRAVDSHNTAAEPREAAVRPRTPTPMNWRTPHGQSCR